jgi:hypothetical protein
MIGQHTKEVEEERANALEMGKEKEKETEEVPEAKSGRALIGSPSAFFFRAVWPAIPYFSKG